jgi:hypothetical protein
VEGDYDVGLVLSFEDVAAYRAYLEHPRHQETTRKWKPLLRSHRVHDLTDEAR